MLWKGLIRYVRESLRNCEICQQHKYDRSASPELLQPLLVPQALFTDISMDFITGLPKSNRNDVILVVFDRLLKYSNFVSLAYLYTAVMVALVFVDEVYRLHGFLNNIVCIYSAKVDRFEQKPK